MNRGDFKNSTERRHSQRARLFKRQDGKCYWCGRQCQPGPHPPGVVPVDAATLDHLDSRFSEQRGKHSGQWRKVMACWYCNNQRSVHEQSFVNVEELRRRSGATEAIKRDPALDKRCDGATLSAHVLWR